MSKNYVDVAEAYYSAMGEKNIAGIEKCLHPEVHFIGPLAKMTGKEAVIDAARKFMGFIESLSIRAKFGSGDQVMLTLDFKVPAPIGHFSGASLLKFQDGLISRIELFYDGRLFDKKKSEIFSEPLQR